MCVRKWRNCIDVAAGEIKQQNEHIVAGKWRLIMERFGTIQLRVGRRAVVRMVGAQRVGVESALAFH